MTKLNYELLLLSVLTLTACSENSDNANLENQEADNGQNNVVATPSNSLDQQLGFLLNDQSITGDPTSGLDLISINDPIAQLGMKLFYSNSLGGEMDSACVTCHHPTLGGTDNLSLSVGVDAMEVDVLAPAGAVSTVTLLYRATHQQPLIVAFTDAAYFGIHGSPSSMAASKHQTALREALC